MTLNNAIAAAKAGNYRAKNYNNTVTTKQRMGPGGYEMVIMRAKDVPNKEYISMELEVASGPHEGHCQNIYDANAFWPLTAIRSYARHTLPHLKAFIQKLEKSNPGFKVDFDKPLENQIVGKRIGALIATEHYISREGEEKTRLAVVDLVPIQGVEEARIPEDVYSKNFREAMEDKASRTPTWAQPQEFTEEDEDDEDGDLPF